MSESSNNPYAMISVSEPILQQSTNDKLSSYVTYLIAGEDPHGIFHIRHRFREFLILRDKLVQRFIGMYVPPIPSKKASGNTEEQYVEERRKFLNYFCLKISYKPYIFDSDIFQTFIRGDPDFERAARFISGHQYALIANIYDIQFRALAQQLDLTKITIEVQQQAENLRKIQKRLTTIRSQVQDIVQAKKSFINQYSFCYNNILPRFEKQILSYHGDLTNQIVLSQNPQFAERLAQYLYFNEANPLHGYVQSLTYDIRQARALLQAIQSRKHLQNKKSSFQSARRESKEELQKLKSGRMSIKSLFTSGSKENQIKQLQSYIPKYERNQSFVGMCLPLSAVAIHRDIQQFKKSRSIDYLATIQINAHKQLVILNLYTQMLKASEKTYNPQPNPIIEENIEQQAKLNKEQQLNQQISQQVKQQIRDKAEQ